ncbi:MAG TPA: PLP-dependent aminotransferase family protein [Solirubrobacterales bacterium]|nr:PLP-dependent aminotransferase family protein [Solirubrobacterales bacterium]
MSDLDRDGERSITQQLVDVIAAAIADGELAAGAKLPPTRELAELAGVNHLTAVRVYRRLRELGLVSAHVGRGTFVRETASPDPGAVPDSIAWQRFALPEFEEHRSSRVIADMQLQAQAEGLIPLSVGHPSARLFPIEAIREAAGAVLAREPERALQYAELQGIPELTDELGALGSYPGAPEDPRDIVVTTGAQQGISLVVRALVRPGDAVACESPTFMGVLEAMRATDADLLPVSSDDDGIDVDELEALLARREIKLLALQSRVSNPTGRDLAPERRERLLALARRHGFFVLEDGVYSRHRFEGEALPSLRSVAPAHVIYVDSLSKTVGGGLRVGWVIASGPVLERIVAAKRADDLLSPTLTQLTAARFLASGALPGHVERTTAAYRERRDVLLEAIEKRLGPIASHPRPLGGHHLWLTLDLPVDERSLFDEAVRHGVAYVPGAAMTVEPSRALSMRLSYCYCEPDEIVEGVRRLAAAARAARARPALSGAVSV